MIAHIHRLRPALPRCDRPPLHVLFLGRKRESLIGGFESGGERELPGSIHYYAAGDLDHLCGDGWLAARH